MADLQELRILRDRQAAFGRMNNRAAESSPLINARTLVQVYNGGAMPTSPDKVYLTHPVELDGTETEGGSATTNVDTSTTIPVAVLWGAPQAGDLLTAYAVGGRWVAERVGRIKPGRLSLRPVSNPADEPHRLVGEPDPRQWVDHARLFGQPDNSMDFRLHESAPV